MNDQDRRTVAFLGMHVFVIPLFIGAVALLNLLRRQFNLSDLSHAFLMFAAFGLVYVGTGYAVAAWLRR